ncbi:hypothetical protein MPH_07418 [Macrophomina phaseolina MS6]|uniref:Uncharacterized protein n=1 Tax=Macrophomina phaseolina (strain MS6) TaxID=1126212 RepID=K2RRI7_MACPH|nr:hypothetical protein MPH_07418 [Macrophomina phaseolina MS6]
MMAKAMPNAYEKPIWSREPKAGSVSLRKKDAVEAMPGYTGIVRRVTVISGPLGMKMVCTYRRRILRLLPQPSLSTTAAACARNPASSGILGVSQRHDAHSASGRHPLLQPPASGVFQARSSWRNGATGSARVAAVGENPGKTGETGNTVGIKSGEASGEARAGERPLF